MVEMIGTWKIEMKIEMEIHVNYSSGMRSHDRY
jgi:hypothetical protein